MGTPSDPVLAGRAVTLRTASAADVQRLAAIRATPEVRARWAGDDLADEVAESIDDADLHYLAVEVDGVVIGAIQWSEEDDPMYRHAGLDLFIDPSFHGRGLGEDAVRTLCTHLIDDVGHRRLVIDPAADNVGRRSGATRRSGSGPSACCARTSGVSTGRGTTAC